MTMKHPKLSAFIERRGAFRVVLSFRNDGAGEAYLYRPNACLEGRIDNDVFTVFQGTTRVAYTGRYVKRPAPRPHDFLAVPPRSASVVEVDLASAYGLVSGVACTVFYEAFHDNPLGTDDLWEVTSNTITLDG
jgi:hypothetical protein